jgi:uncharacterized integral membrane protein
MSTGNLGLLETSSMSSPYYKRRKRSLIRNLWVYRKLVALAVVVGLLLWFVLTNNEQVTIAFPFGLGSYKRSSGVVILLSAFVGSVVTALAMTFFWAIRKTRQDRDEPIEPSATARPVKDDDLPPPDYAAKTGDGLSREGSWSG